MLMENAFNSSMSYDPHSTNEGTKNNERTNEIIVKYSEIRKRYCTDYYSASWNFASKATRRNEGYCSGSWEGGRDGISIHR